MNVASRVLSRFNQIDKLIWQFKQPLTKKPGNRHSVVSDLFVWRKGQGWRTFFELTDIASLFGQASEPTVVRVLIFDQSGGMTKETIFTAPRHSRLRVDISELAASCSDEVGTFCVLHSRTPDLIANLGSNLAERGYASYCFGNSSLKSYVHGNLDAVSFRPTGAIELLAGTSFLKREYRLQHELRKDKSYDLVVVNASAKTQSVQCELFNAFNTETSPKKDGYTSSFIYLKPEARCRRLHATLKPGSCHIFHVGPSEPKGDSVRIVIKSHLVMLRPIVFEIEGSRIDAFHG